MAEAPKGSIDPAAAEEPDGSERREECCPDLEALQREVERRIRDNRRFLERFLDDDFDEEVPFEEP